MPSSGLLKNDLTASFISFSIGPNDTASEGERYIISLVFVLEFTLCAN